MNCFHDFELKILADRVRFDQIQQRTRSAAAFICILPLEDLRGNHGDNDGIKKNSAASPEKRIQLDQPEKCNLVLWLFGRRC